MKSIIKYLLITFSLSLNLLVISSENNIIESYQFTYKADHIVKWVKGPILDKLSSVNKESTNKELRIDNVFFNKAQSNYEIIQLHNGVSPIAYTNDSLNIYDLLSINKYGYPIVTKYKEPGKTEHGNYINTKKYILVQSLEKSAYCGLIKCTIKEQHFPVEIKEEGTVLKELTLFKEKPIKTIHSWLCPAFNWTLLIGGGLVATYFAYHKWFKK